MKNKTQQNKTFSGSCRECGNDDVIFDIAGSLCRQKPGDGTERKCGLKADPKRSAGELCDKGGRWQDTGEL